MALILSNWSIGVRSSMHSKLFCFPSLHEQSTLYSSHSHFNLFSDDKREPLGQSLFRGYVPGFPRNITHNLFIPAFLMTTGMPFQNSLALRFKKKKNSLALNQPAGASWYISMFDEPWCVASLRAHLAIYSRRLRREKGYVPIHLCRQKEEPYKATSHAGQNWVAAA